MLNLIEDSWIPVRRRSGLEERVAPWQVTDRLLDDPILAPAAPRPDFDGALVQFCIGLLQSCLPPQTPRDWRRLFDNPPAPEQLRDAFGPIHSYFELLGDGPRVLQDLTLGADEAEERRIEKLLIDHGLHTGKDHFVKGGTIQCLCTSCAAAALLTLQINGPSGGRGHRTGIRGAGPLTTLVRHDQSLWATLWLNVLSRDTFEALGGNPALTSPECRFPWLAPTRTSESGTGRATTGDDVHPLQMFWAMPRRIRLIPAENSVEAGCDLCRQPTKETVDRYLSRNLGVNYSGPWLHPLSPHRENKDGLLLPLHGRSADLTYSEWLGLVQADSTTKQIPARVVVDATHQRDRTTRQNGLRLWGFGYQLDNMKSRAWCEGTFPLILAKPEQREEWEYRVGQLVLAAREAAGSLSTALRKALARRVQSMPAPPPEGPSQFMQKTEGGFFAILPSLLDGVERGEDTMTLRQTWRATLVTAALQVFDTYAQVGQFRAVAPRQVARARNDLRRFLYGKKIRTLLDLPEPTGTVDA